MYTTVGTMGGYMGGMYTTVGTSGRLLRKHIHHCWYTLGRQ